MLTARENRMGEKRAERISKCQDRQIKLAAMELTVTATCIDCGGGYYLHPVYGRSPRCCACKVAQIETKQRSQTASYEPRPGYPKRDRFQSMQEVEAYFAHEKITCLVCGHDFKGLQQHINHVHLLSAEQYKVDFGIPFGFGLVGTATRDAISAATSKRHSLMTVEER